MSESSKEKEAIKHSHKTDNSELIKNESNFKKFNLNIPKLLPIISGTKKLDHSISLKGNIENFVGYAQVPIGLTSPLKVHGKNITGSYTIPLATTEGTLVASYNRGIKACTLSGGVTSICIEDSLERVPYFQFKDLRLSLKFRQWLEESYHTFKAKVNETSRYCRLVGMRFHHEGNGISIYFNYRTGDAAGQNMVTIATDAICKYILKTFPIKPTCWYIEANASGDKKGTLRSLNSARGKKVIAEVKLPRSIVRSVLKTTPEHMCKYFLTSTLSGLSTGTLGNTGHIANGLTAIFLACGQDVACVAESSAGILRMEITDDDHLYVALTLSALVVGTVGGGTHLATQAEALNIIGCLGSDKAQVFAEICCATALAGELSIAAALAENHFTRAHKALGRKH